MDNPSQQMQETPERCAELFRAIILMVGRSGTLLFPGKSAMWSTEVGPWEIWVNPRKEDEDAIPLGGVSVPPQTAYVKYRTSPVGFVPGLCSPTIPVALVNAEGGAFAAFDLATLDNLLEALRMATEAAPVLGKPLSRSGLLHD